MIPEDAKHPKKQPYPENVKRTKPKPKPDQNKPEMPEQKKAWTEREINRHIRRYCGTRTYRQLSEEMGISTEEVRRRYERLHRMYGI